MTCETIEQRNISSENMIVYEKRNTNRKYIIVYIIKLDNDENIKIKNNFF